MAWKLRGALKPAGDSVTPVGEDSEAQGTTVELVLVEVLQNCAARNAALAIAVEVVLGAAQPNPCAPCRQDSRTETDTPIAANR